MKNIMTVLFLCLCAASATGQDKEIENDTLEVYFPLREGKVGRRASDFIDSLIFKDVLIHGQKLVVLGYTDYIGGKAYNEALSEERAKNVQAYLVRSGFDKKDITLCIGKGKIERKPTEGQQGYAT